MYQRRIVGGLSKVDRSPVNLRIWVYDCLRRSSLEGGRLARRRARAGRAPRRARWAARPWSSAPAAPARAAPRRAPRGASARARARRTAPPRSPSAAPTRCSAPTRPARGNPSSGTAASCRSGSPPPARLRPIESA